MPSPDNVTEPAKLLLPRDEERTPHHVPLDDFALSLRLQYPPSWGGWFQLLRIGWLHQRKCLAFRLLYKDVGDVAGLGVRSSTIAVCAGATAGRVVSNTMRSGHFRSE